MPRGCNSSPTPCSSQTSRAREIIFSLPACHRSSYRRQAVQWQGQRPTPSTPRKCWDYSTDPSSVPHVNNCRSCTNDTMRKMSATKSNRSDIVFHFRLPESIWHICPTLHRISTDEHQGQDFWQRSKGSRQTARNQSAANSGFGVLEISKRRTRQLNMTATSIEAKETQTHIREQD